MKTQTRTLSLSRRRFIAAATAVTTFSATGLVRLGNLGAAVAADPKIDALVAKAVDYLAKQQSPDGAFSPQSGVGVTALVTTGLLRNGRSPDDPLVAHSLKFLESSVQPDGGIYTPKLGYKNYETCIGLTCFVEANADKRYEKIIRNAEKYPQGTRNGPRRRTKTTRRRKSTSRIRSMAAPATARTSGPTFPTPLS